MPTGHALLSQSCLWDTSVLLMMQSSDEPFDQQKV